jgi:hypothetical protein
VWIVHITWYTMHPLIILVDRKAICSWFMRMRFRCNMVLVSSNRNLKLTLHFLQNFSICRCTHYRTLQKNFAVKCASYTILPSSSSETNTIFINCNLFQLLDSCRRRISDHMVMVFSLKVSGLAMGDHDAMKRFLAVSLLVAITCKFENHKNFKYNIFACTL